MLEWSCSNYAIGGCLWALFSLTCMYNQEKQCDNLPIARGYRIQWSREYPLKSVLETYVWQLMTYLWYIRVYYTSGVCGGKGGEHGVNCMEYRRRWSSEHQSLLFKRLWNGWIQLDDFIALYIHVWLYLYDGTCEFIAGTFSLLLSSKRRTNLILSEILCPSMDSKKNILWPIQKS